MANKQIQEASTVSESEAGKPTHVVEENRMAKAAASLTFVDESDDETPDPKPIAKPATGEGGESKEGKQETETQADSADSVEGLDDTEGLDGVDTSKPPPEHAWKSLRRQKREVKDGEKKLLAKIDEIDRSLREREDKLARREKLMREDPDAYYKEVGLDPDEIYTRQTRKRLQQGEDVPEAVREKMTELEKRLAAFEERDERQKAEQQKASEANQFRAQVEYFGDQAEAGKAVFQTKDGAKEVDMRKLAPNFMKLHPDLRKARMEAAAAWAIKNDPDMPYPELLKKLDHLAKPEVEYILSQAQGGDTLGDQPQKPGGRGSRKPEQRPNSMGAATIHNEDVAQGGGSGSNGVDTPETRRARAESSLRFLDD